MPRDSTRHTLLVATVLCVVCSVLVSGAAVGLRGTQDANRLLDRQKNVLSVSGLLHTPGSNGALGSSETRNTHADISQLFKSSVKQQLIDLATGEAVDPTKVDPTTYNPRAAAKDPKQSLLIPPDKDLAGIHQREKYAFVYIIKKNKKIVQIVLPVYGKGLWSTLYGFLALDADTTTVQGITFYDEAETPGLGGEITNPTWQALWKGKKIFGSQGKVAFRVIKGTVDENSPQASHQVDGLSGASITSRGVSNLVRYWLGPDGFGPYLKKFRERNQNRPKASGLTYHTCPTGGNHG